ncbi:MAG: maltodextrin glycosyltransferase [Longicatena sp.]
MKNLHMLYEELNKEEKTHRDTIYNYVIPESWNSFGFSKGKKIHNKQRLVNPYSFYAFTLQKIFKDENNEWIAPIPFEQEENWLKKASVYAFMVRSASAWDHDRDDNIHHDNLYHLCDNGTFLKSITLLPLLKRMGINTLLMQQPFALAKTSHQHNYAKKEAVTSFQMIDEDLRDPMLPKMTAIQQCSAFVEACHHLGIRVILEYCPGNLARENSYFTQNPEWFYWIDDKALASYSAPTCSTLPQQTIPYFYTLKDFYKSQKVIEHLKSFRVAPTLTNETTLNEVENIHHATIAPLINDQINTTIPADRDRTTLRFYSDSPAHTKALIAENTLPYMLQDILRADLYHARKPQKSLWNMLNKNITWFQKALDVDGIYLTKPYLLPEKLQTAFVKTAHKNKENFVMIVQEPTIERGVSWLSKGYDAISGNGGYEESNVYEYKLHNFVSRLRNSACPLFAACEFADSKRVSSLEQGKTLTKLLTIMNQFLPNGIPLMMNGIESYEVQPLQLSSFGDKKYLYSLPKEDFRYHKQAYLDEYYFDYCANDLHVLPALLEKTRLIRATYIEAIIHHEKNIPVWFDSPEVYGIGTTFILEDKALMVVCSTNIHVPTTLHIHTENMLSELPFYYQSIRQIFSSEDPYVQDISFDMFQNINLEFAPGEVKFIELSAK